MTDFYKAKFYKSIKRNLKNKSARDIYQYYAEFVYCYDILRNIYHDNLQILKFTPSIMRNNWQEFAWEPVIIFKSNEIEYNATFNFITCLIRHTVSEFLVEIDISEQEKPETSFCVMANPFDCSVDYNLIGKDLSDWTLKAAIWKDDFTNKYGKPPTSDNDVIMTYEQSLRQIAM